ncbi:Rab5 GDP/GTP exchange factor [Cichlidogyrus casuarinus]|uniref:Rab5 GDP/GTP exchange factor n=1 Tax=Cichlidogyrus casuarinus TaxID=1844966 RepID=A0ABD2PVA9_9PLAT
MVNTIVAPAKPHNLNIRNKTSIEVILAHNPKLQHSLKIELLEEPKRKSSQSNLPEAHQLAKEHFSSYISTFKTKTQTEIVRLVATIIDPTETFSSIDQYSEALQNFYSSINEKIEKDAMFSYIEPNEKIKLQNEIEIFITSWIHSWAFCCRTTDDEQEDTKLSEKIRSLDWVSSEMLNSPINASTPRVSKLIEDTILSLVKLNSVNSTLEKLECIVNCCRGIFKALNVHNTEGETKKPTDRDGTTNADEFLPVLIWIVLKSNPPQLHCHLQYITRFTNQNRLSFGEQGYFFTNLSIAVQFIRNLNHDSLKMSEKEFGRRMRGVHPAAKDATEGQKILADNDVALLDIEESLASSRSMMEQVERDLISFDDEISLKINEIHAKYPLDLTVQLDPRHIENPEILCLSPFEVPSSSNPATHSSNEQQYQEELMSFFK